MKNKDPLYNLLGITIIVTTVKMKDVQRLVTQGAGQSGEGERIRLVLPRAIQHSSPSPPSFLVAIVTGGMREHRVTGDRSVESKVTSRLQRRVTALCGIEFVVLKHFN
ncbi:hypothetical protein TNCV_1923951 [Trichonephila clavipes]|nr:hypothetical protein TNCV_1923951 [Trichonephila clavipes]